MNRRLRGDLGEVATGTGLRVDLGSTDSIDKSCTHGLDIVDNPALAGRLIVADLNKDWPFDDGGVDHFRAHDIIEHLPDKIHTMNEAWRCLKHGGTFDILVPLFPMVGAVCDPQHVSFWSRHSFDYFIDGKGERERFARHYAIKAKFVPLQESVKHYVVGNPAKNEVVEHLHIVLQAVKP